MPIGRPLKYKSSKELEEAIQAYFDNQKLEGKPIIITGLCVWLDIDKNTFYRWLNREWEGENNQLTVDEQIRFSESLKRARQRIESYAEEQLFIGKNQVGTIFNLKNNFKWKDQHELTGKDGGPLQVGWLAPGQQIIDGELVEETAETPVLTGETEPSVR